MLQQNRTDIMCHILECGFAVYSVTFDTDFDDITFSHQYTVEPPNNRHFGDNITSRAIIVH